MVIRIEDSSTLPPTPPVETGLGNKARRPAIESLPRTCINNFFPIIEIAHIHADILVTQDVLDHILQSYAITGKIVHFYGLTTA